MAGENLRCVSWYQSQVYPGRDLSAIYPRSKGGSLSAIYPGRDREMKELWDTVAGADSEDDQEGVRTMDDDNFIDDTGVDPADQYGSDNEGFIGDAPQLEKGHGIRESLDILLGKAVSYNPLGEEEAARMTSLV
ncbi:hypothetical protein Syun_000508 [Stephania yunnanensis]|uniref:Uncharacterized protein n=1 Tax=Stephania yunnanensis TaxID=152371 RepID=A0AAP0Q660_9MAGN